MRNILVTALIILSSLITHAQVKKVLFIGNSYTYVNDLPQLIKDIALSYGDTMLTGQNTPGGYQLIQHASDATTLSKIALTNWDNVILQEQSQKPSFSPAQVQMDVYPYAKILNDSIKTNYSCTETVFYMTWGRKNGDASNCASYPPVCTYAGMQQRLRESYLEMADSNKATVAPVGVAWKMVRDSFPLIELYQPDESHPSIYGSYLAACVFYSTLYEKSTIGCSFVPAGINSTDALNLQTIASNTVLDSLSLWRVGANIPIADFNFSGGGTINFNNTSTNGSTYFWDFGDGNTSTSENPSNTYMSNATYPVQLIIYSQDSCFSDTVTKNVTISTTTIEPLSSKNKTSIYPNPANDNIVIETDISYSSIEIIDITGKMVEIIEGHITIIDVSNLKKGIYFIRLIGEKDMISKMFTKE